LLIVQLMRESGIRLQTTRGTKQLFLKVPKIGKMISASLVGLLVGTLIEHTLFREAFDVVTRSRRLRVPDEWLSFQIRLTKHTKIIPASLLGLLIGTLIEHTLFREAFDAATRSWRLPRH
jgi:uncharacterized membrane protein AbrB (regulator of aidB expression)